MKKVLLTIISVCLIAASIFGLFAGVTGLQDAQNLSAYKTQDSEDGLAAVDTLLDGIAQLKENEDTYLAGVDTYTAGLISYSEGKSTLSAGYAAYYAGKKQLEEGKAAYAAGKKQIEDNTQAYNEGKAQLAKIEPLMPYVNQYVDFRNGTIANLGGFSSAQAWFVSVVRPIAANMGLVIPDDVTDLPAYIQQMVADGKAQLKQYEDGLVQLAEAEKAIAAGEAQLRDAEKQLAQGEVDLANGGNQLADGKKQLSVFEDGAAQVAAGLELLLSEGENSTGTYHYDEGKSVDIACPSIKQILIDRYGENWTFWQTDENGQIVVKNGCQYLDLDACEQAAYAAQDYINAYQGDPNVNFQRIWQCITHAGETITYDNLGHDVTLPCDQCQTVIREVLARIILAILTLVTSVLGLIAAIFGLIFVIRGRGVCGRVLGWVTAGFGIVTAIFGFCTHFQGYIYPIALYDGDTRSGYEYSSHLPATAVIILAIVAILFAIVATIIASAYKRSKKAVIAQADAAAAPVAHCQSSAVTNCRPLRDTPPTSVTLPLPVPRSDSTSPGATGASGRRHSV